MSDLHSFYIHHFNALLDQLLNRFLSHSDTNKLRVKFIDILQEFASNLDFSKNLNDMDDLDIVFKDDNAEVDVVYDGNTSSIVWYGIDVKHHEKLRKITKFMIFALKNSVYEWQLLQNLDYALPNIQTRASWWQSLKISPLPSPQEQKWSDVDIKNTISKLSPFFNAFGYNSSEESSDRFQKLIHRLDSIICSISPFVKFPPPFLLKRMHSEQKFQNLHKVHKRVNSHSSLSASLTRFKRSESERYVMSNYDRQSLDSLVVFDDSLDGILGDQSFVCLFSFGRKTKETNEKEKNGNENNEKEKNESEASAVVRPPCIMKEMHMKFYDDTDVSLKEFLLDLSTRYEVCGRSSFDKSCEGMVWDHEMRFNSGQVKITVDFERIEKADSDKENKEIYEMEGWKVFARTTCSICDVCSEEKEVSDTSLNISFGKFLELMSFNSLFVPHNVEFCKEPLERWESPYYTDTASIKPSSESILSKEKDPKKFWTFSRRSRKINYLNSLNRPPSPKDTESTNVFYKFKHLGACPVHRSSLTLELTVNDTLKVKFRQEPVSLKEISLPSQELNKDVLVKNDDDPVRFAADGCGPLITPFSGISALIDMVNSYWDGVFQYMDLLTNIGSSGSSLLFKGSANLSMKSEIEEFYTLLEKEKQQMNKWLESESNDLGIRPNFLSLQENKKQTLWFAYRSLRRDVHNKVISIDREITYLVNSLTEKYEQNLPPYEPSFHPDSFWRRVHPVNLQSDKPSSFIAFALSSWEVRECMCVLEEIGEEVEKRLSNSLAKDDINGDPLKKRIDLVTELLKERENTLFESWNTKDLTFTQAYILDNVHINFRCQKFIDKESFEIKSREFYAELDAYDTASTLPEQPDEFSVILYYPYFFHVLRNKFKLSTDDFIESIASCSEWKPTGGKSDAPFYKTADERFILKHFPVRRWFPKASSSSTSHKSNSMKKGEYTNNESVSTIRKYLSYLLYSCDASALCKILGEYKLIFKQKEEEVDTHFVIMENLYYGKRITHQFDLKGIRTRKLEGQLSSPQLHMLTKTKEKKGQTMWDGEWIQSIYGNNFDLSLSIHPHSRHLLFSTLEKDTKFLTDANIIDYSLLIGVDAFNNELCVGVVDYLCEYSFWKKLESKGKVTLKVIENTVKKIRDSSTGRGEKTRNWFFDTRNRSDSERSDAGDEVTIQPPEKYRERFVRSLNLYFPHIPDKWEKRQ